MTVDEFKQLIKRHEALKEYSQAYNLCISSLANTDLVAVATECAKKLVQQNKYNVMEGTGTKRSITVAINLSMEWIIDAAISLGYKTLEKGTISTGVFSSVPCVMIGGLMAKQKFGVRKNKNETYTFYYSLGTFANDFKLITHLCNSLIDLVAQKYHEY